jgi:hypothetical protein
VSEAPKLTSSSETGGYGLYGVLGSWFLFGTRLGDRLVLVCRGRVRCCGSRRRCRGVQLIANPADRRMSERGKRPGGARRPLRGFGAGTPSVLPSGRGGGPVVVVAVTRHQGGRETRPQGEGVQ